MLYHAKNGIVSGMRYAAFGSGEASLVMLPGLSDGLSTVRGKAVLLAAAYRIYAKQYRVYLFSRKERLPREYPTRRMAADQAEALRALGISKASVLGISQGGMIAQYLAIDHPELVDKLVLAVTSPNANDTVRRAVGVWIDLAKRGDYAALMADTAERSYSERYLKRYRRLYPLLRRVGKPKSFDRFLTQAESCLRHDARTELGKIACPTLVIGGGRDKIVGPEAAPTLADRIRGSELFVYEDLGHGAYEEARDFNRRVLDFLER